MRLWVGYRWVDYQEASLPETTCADPEPEAEEAEWTEEQRLEFLQQEEAR